MKLPVQNPKHTYRTLEDIQERKDELLEQLHTDNSQFGTKWNQLFAPKKDRSKAEFIGSLLTNSITVIDVFLVVRKLLKSHRSIFGSRRKS